MVSIEEASQTKANYAAVFRQVLLLVVHLWRACHELPDIVHETSFSHKADVNSKIFHDLMHTWGLLWVTVSAGTLIRTELSYNVLI